MIISRLDYAKFQRTDLAKKSSTLKRAFNFVTPPPLPPSNINMKHYLQFTWISINRGAERELRDGKSGRVIVNISNCHRDSGGGGQDRISVI